MSGSQPGTAQRRGKFEIGGKKETFKVIDTQVEANKAFWILLHIERTEAGWRNVDGGVSFGGSLSDCSSLVLLEQSEGYIPELL